MLNTKHDMGILGKLLFNQFQTRKIVILQRIRNKNEMMVF